MPTRGSPTPPRATSLSLRHEVSCVELGPAASRLGGAASPQPGPRTLSEVDDVDRAGRPGVARHRLARSCTAARGQQCGREAARRAHPTGLRPARRRATSCPMLTAGAGTVAVSTGADRRSVARGPDPDARRWLPTTSSDRQGFPSVPARRPRLSRAIPRAHDHRRVHPGVMRSGNGRRRAVVRPCARRPPRGVTPRYAVTLPTRPRAGERPLYRVAPTRRQR